MLARAPSRIRGQRGRGGVFNICEIITRERGAEPWAVYLRSCGNHVTKIVDMVQPRGSEAAPNLQERPERGEGTRCPIR